MQPISEAFDGRNCHTSVITAPILLVYWGDVEDARKRESKLAHQQIAAQCGLADASHGK